MIRPGPIAAEIRKINNDSQQQLAEYMTAEGCRTDRNAIAYGESEDGFYSGLRLLLFCKRYNILDPAATFLGQGNAHRLNERGLRALNEATDVILAHKPYLELPSCELRLAPHSVAAGPGVAGDAIDDIWVTVPLEDIPPVRNRDALMVAKVYGYSMEPHIHDGDYIIYMPCKVPRPGQVILCFYDYGMMVKVYQQEGDKAWLESYNEEFYDPIPLKEGFAFECQGEYMGRTTALSTHSGRPA